MNPVGNLVNGMLNALCPQRVNTNPQRYPLLADEVPGTRNGRPYYKRSVSFPMQETCSYSEVNNNLCNWGPRSRQAEQGERISRPVSETTPHKTSKYTFTTQRPTRRGLPNDTIMIPIEVGEDPDCSHTTDQYELEYPLLAKPLRSLPRSSANPYEKKSGNSAYDMELFVNESPPEAEEQRDQRDISHIWQDYMSLTIGFITLYISSNGFTQSPTFSSFMMGMTVVFLGLFLSRISS